MKNCYPIPALALLMACGWVHAQLPDDGGSERARIAAQRGQAEARFVTEEKACYALFAVNDCLQEARARRRGILSDLRRQEVALNDAERRRKAAERLKELEERSSADRQQRAAEQRASALVRQKAREDHAAEKAAKAGKVEDPALAETGEEVQPKGKPGKALRKHQAAPKALDTRENAQAHEERLRQARARKALAEKKLAERSKPAAKGLPLP